MNGAVLRLWLAVAVGACVFSGQDGDSSSDDSVDDSSDGDGPDDGIPDAGDPGDGGVDAPPDAAPDASFCTPNVSTCTGRELATCNADGSAITTTTCDLACVDGACFTASNLTADLQQSCTPAAPSIAIGTGETGTIERSAMPVLTAGGHSVPATIVPGTADAPPLAVFCLGGLAIAGGGQLVENGVGDSNAAVVLLVMGDVDIAGQLRVDGRAAGAVIAGRGGMGGFAGGDAIDASSGDHANGPCPGRGGGRNSMSTEAAAGGGGGGGNGGLGGEGGVGYAGNTAGIPLLIGPGGDGGLACTSPALVPLVGGSGGGSGADGTCVSQCGYAGGGGGGALQLSASGTIAITGVVSAEGGSGFSVGSAGDLKSGAAGGGGAGGSILVEAPAVSLGANTLRVLGGNGGSSQAGAGGAGATTTLDGAPGADASTLTRRGGAGGGGAAGRVRVNALGAPACASAAAPVAACTVGPLASQP